MTTMRAALLFFSRSTASGIARMGGPRTPDGSLSVAGGNVKLTFTPVEAL
jgi:hypothetical protein